MKGGNAASSTSTSSSTPTNPPASSSTLSNASAKSYRASKLCRVGLYDLVPGPPLGKGNFAVVRLGIHRLTKTKVAVKIVDKADLEDDNLQKITREIEIMRRLSHPAIIRLYQVRKIQFKALEVTIRFIFKRFDS